MRKYDEPTVLGRFNYLSFKTDKFNVLFVPFAGAANITIAKNLSKEEALALIEDLNDAIDETRRGFVEVETEEM